MASLVTVDAAKAHLRIPASTTARDVDIQALADAASAIVILHLNGTAVAGWSDGTVAVPGGVTIATLLLMAQLDEHRGDDGMPDEAWQMFLIPFRDSALA